MNTGTAIFLIVLLLVGSFIGLGYTINHSATLQTKVKQLEGENQTLNDALATEESARIKVENQVSALQKRIDDLSNALEQERILRKAAEKKAADLEELVQQTDITTNPNVRNMAIVIPSGMGIISLLALVLHSMHKSRSKKETPQFLHIHPRFGPPCIRSEEVLAIRMTRQQLKDYLRFQRTVVK